MAKTVKDSLDTITLHLYNAALEVDEFKNLSMDLQGEITKRTVTWFIDCITDEVSCLGESIDGD